MGGICLLCGTGQLPARLAQALRARSETCLIAAVAGFAPDALVADIEVRLERLVPFLEHLRGLGIDRVLFAGAVRRPRLDPALFDPRTAEMLPRLLSAMEGGDDATLRGILEIFTEAGVQVTGVEAVAPALLPAPGILGAVAPTAADRRDAARAAGIVAALGAVDVGQGAVVAQGLCLAVETLPGTDAMLDWVGQTAAALRPDPQGARGTFYKAAKPGQDRRIDLPVIGPDTLRHASAAGLAGIAFEAGGVILLDRAETIAAADAAGLFLWAREP